MSLARAPIAASILSAVSRLSDPLRVRSARTRPTSHLDVRARPPIPLLDGLRIETVGHVAVEVGEEQPDLTVKYVGGTARLRRQSVGILLVLGLRLWAVTVLRGKPREIQGRAPPLLGPEDTATQLCCLKREALCLGVLAKAQQGVRFHL